MQVINRNWESLRRFAKQLGPYLMLEILLPGGTLFALLFFLYRSGKFNIGSLPLRALLARIS
jgi:hypothetical protein